MAAAGVAAVVVIAWILWQDRPTPVAAPQPAQVPPDLNVLLITMDTTRADCLGCYGGPGARTPKLDELAAEGTRFARCSACSPLTLPSHCTIMTGTYPFVHGVRQNGIDRLAAENVTLAESLKGAGYTTHAVVASFVLRAMFGLSQGFDSYRDVPGGQGSNPAAAERKADAVYANAMSVLRAIAGQKFFLWVHFYDPHYPYESPRAADEASPEAYADEVSFMDAQIGRLVRELAQLPITRKTVVILVGDHGEGLGDHGESEHGYLVYETAMRVPLILWCPGVIPAGRVIESQVRTVDIVPTIFDYVGQRPVALMQGTSLRPLISGAAHDLELAAYGESMTANRALGMSVLRSLQYDGWKFISSSRPELYRLDDDPGERDNLISGQPERAARMRARLAALVVDAAAPGRGAEGAVLSPEDIERFASLGYVIPQSDSGASTSSATAALEPVGDNPADRIGDIELFARGHRLMAEGQYDAAGGLLLQAVMAMPRAPEPLYEFGRLLRRLNREDEILEVCERVLAADPEADVARRYYAQNLLRVGRTEEGVAQLEAVVARHPGQCEVRLELADTLLRLDRLEEAQVHYLKAKGTDPRSSRALRGLSVVCERQGRLAEAAGYLREAIAVDPESARLEQDLRRVLAKLTQ